LWSGTRKARSPLRADGVVFRWCFATTDVATPSGCAPQ